MEFLNNAIKFINNQEAFIKIGFYVGASYFIIFIGYLVGQFMAKITG